jgi:hypothetical protein
MLGAISKRNVIPSDLFMRLNLGIVELHLMEKQRGSGQKSLSVPSDTRTSATLVILMPYLDNVNLLSSNRIKCSSYSSVLDSAY